MYGNMLRFLHICTGGTTNMKTCINMSVLYIYVYMHVYRTYHYHRHHRIRALNLLNNRLVGIQVRNPFARLDLETVRLHFFT